MDSRLAAFTWCHPKLDVYSIACSFCRIKPLLLKVMDQGCLLVMVLLVPHIDGWSEIDDNNHIYGDNEVVTLWVNGPFHNPTETYAYYDLPYCHPEHGIERAHRPAGIGETLEGYELRNSGLKMHFAQDIKNEEVCEMVLNEETAKQFHDATNRQYWYELVVDDLPMWGMEVLHDTTKNSMVSHIFTHRTLSLSYNGEQSSKWNLTSENPIPIEAGRKLPFTYSVSWTKTDKPFVDRFNRYLRVRLL